MKSALGTLQLLVFAVVLASTTEGFAQTPYYAGKTITIVRGGGAGGSGEFQSRALMPFLKKYIPGNPTFTMDFMDGASGRKAANYFYTANPDGLKIASAGNMISGPILGLPGSNYDIDKFIHIGSTETGNPYVFLAAGPWDWIASTSFATHAACGLRPIRWATRFTSPAACSPI